MPRSLTARISALAPRFPPPVCLGNNDSGPKEGILRGVDLPEDPQTVGRCVNQTFRSFIAHFHGAGARLRGRWSEDGKELVVRPAKHFFDGLKSAFAVALSQCRSGLSSAPHPLLNAAPLLSHCGRRGGALDERHRAKP